MVKIGTVDPLSLLERKDKWFLGGGKGAIYAPPFPRWLESPGFWDESYFADIRLTRLFTVLFCDFGGHPVRLRGEMVSWRPDRMIIEHRSTTHSIRETRLVTEEQEWVSVFELITGEPLHAFVWSLADLKEAGYGTPWQSLTACEVGEDRISFEFATAWPSELEPDRTGIDAERILNRAIDESNNQRIQGMLPPLTLRISLSANQPRLSHTVNLAQRHDDPPLWETSLLPQKLRDGRLPGDFKLWVGPPPIEGLVHILQQYEFGVGEPLVVSAAVSTAEAPAGRQRSQGSVDVVAESEQAWRAYFASVPQFSSSDPFLTNAYWYRWYGLRLNTVDIPELPICRSIGFQPMRNETFQVSDSQVPGVQGQDGPGTHRLEADVTFSPFVTEGVGFFRNFVTYSAQAHLREVAWMHSPRLAIGILENLEKCQRDDGSFPGHNYSCRPARDFYHADFATGAKLAKTLHPADIHKKDLKALRRYVMYLVKNRKIGFGSELQPAEDRLAGGTFAVLDQNETGQEYMSRYQFVSEKADQWGSFIVGGCDATTYASMLMHYVSRCFRMYQLKNIAWIDEEDEVGFGLWHLYDKEESFFCDITLDGIRSPARPATGFYPFLSVYPETYLQCLKRWLFNPAEFWLPRGFPATALSDPTFSGDGEWKDKRLNCPWSGRSWPMVNSHLVDVIANVARWMEPSETESERRRIDAERSEATREEMIAELLEAFGSEEPEDGEVSNLDLEDQVQSAKLLSSFEPEVRDDVKGDGFEPELEETLISPFAEGELRTKASEALMKAITLMFHQNDPSRPNSYEHYDPITGTPSLYRGYDDYMHSWIVDLIMRHAVGVIPGEDHVDPLPLGVDWIECTDIPHPRGRLSVRIENDQVVRCEVVGFGTDIPGISVS